MRNFKLDGNIAAAFLATISAFWFEAIFRLLGTWTSLPTVYRLYGPRTGYISAMWCTELILALIIFLIFARIWRGRQEVGRLSTWVWVLALSFIILPAIGEIGTAWFA